ncbi:hypothetical protein ACWEO1_19085 [Kitasatospora cineracea]
MGFLLKPTTYARYRAYVLGELIPVFGRLRLEDPARGRIAACTHRLPFNAAQPLPVRRPRADERAPWSAERAVGFLTHCRNVDPAFADLFETIIGTGPRRERHSGFDVPASGSTTASCSSATRCPRWTTTNSS